MLKITRKRARVLPMRMNAKLRRRLSSDSGAELVEYAIAVPVLFALIIGIIVVGRGYNIYQTLTRAAMEGARVAVANSCATCGNAAPSDAAIKSAIQGALQASGIDTTVAGGPNCSYPPSSPYISPPGPLNTTTPQEIGVTITVCYPYRLSIPFYTSSPFAISTTVQMRQEN